VVVDALDEAVTPGDARLRSIADDYYEQAAAEAAVAAALASAGHRRPGKTVGGVRRRLPAPGRWASGG